MALHCTNELEQELESLERYLSSGWWHTDRCRLGEKRCGSECREEFRHVRAEIREIEDELHHHWCGYCDQVYKMHHLVADFLLTGGDGYDAPYPVWEALAELDRAWREYTHFSEVEDALEAFEKMILDHEHMIQRR